MTRDDPPFIPDALSHRQLNQLLKMAQRSAPHTAHAAGQQGSGDARSLDLDLDRWATLTRQLLQQIAQEGDGLGAHRSSQQVMALGSFRTHLMLGLQALKAARS
ncbi:MAG: hypothetical protein VXZ59_08260 [Cyanobacteriota bacterium]|nr:hypothetical protein [Cyanobacteriota bacterium]